MRNSKKTTEATTPAPPMLPMDALLALKKEADGTLAWVRCRLAQQAESVEQTAGLIKARMRSDDTDPNVSMLGELQASGTILDTLCARYATQRETCRYIDGMIEMVRAGEAANTPKPS